VLAFGSNLGDREATIRAAIAELDARGDIRVKAVSSLIGSVAVKPGGEDLTAPPYLNAVAIILTTLGPHELLDVTSAIEQNHGRVRTERWGDRTLDIDIIAIGDRVISDERLIVPHPRAAEREFVLAPWLEIDPNAELPGLGRVDAVLARLRESRPAQDGTPA